MKLLLALAIFLSTLAFSEPETFEQVPFAKSETGLKLQPGWSKTAKFRSALQTLSLPRNFDWREQGTLTPSKDQGSCGSCWSFSTVVVLQDIIALKDKTQVRLSEQFLLSCNTRGWSCNGGDFANDMHVNPGAVPESEFPYAGRQVACKQGLSHPYRLDSWAYLPASSEDVPPSLDEIKSAIYQFGPLAVAVGANDAFSSYKSGVFNKCDGTEPNHAVTLVGWNDDGQYFIMKNSWSSSWGEGGYMKIRYNCNKIGIGANYVMFKGGSPTPGPAPAPGPAPQPKPQPQPQPIPKCTPMPYANAGNNYRIYPGQWVLVGTNAMPQTAYMWEVNGRANPRYNTARLRAQVFADAIFTVYATTKCGTARSSVMVIVNRRR